MTRRVWGAVWDNFLNSFRGQRKVKTLVGKDQFGNHYYEYQQPTYASNVKRGFEAPANAPPPPPEWNMWLKNTRRFPPSDEEVYLSQLSQQKMQAQLAQDAETERRAPKVGSTGKGAADVDRGTVFPTYDDIELGPGHVPDYKHQAAADRHKRDRSAQAQCYPPQSRKDEKAAGNSSEDAGRK